MKILFYGTKNYDEQFFERLLPEYPEISIKYIEANLQEETAALADQYIRIPMEGQVESLNAGVASALLMYEAFRQRRQG